jgi:hypothetical protein
MTMIIRGLGSAALITALGFYLVDGAHAQTSSDQTTPVVDTAQKKSGETPDECEAVEHKPGQQEIIEGKQDLSSASKEKTAHEINKEIVAAMSEKKLGKSGESKAGTPGTKTAKEINKEIVSNTKETESGKVSDHRSDSGPARRHSVMAAQSCMGLRAGRHCRAYPRYRPDPVPARQDLIGHVRLVHRLVTKFICAAAGCSGDCGPVGGFRK